MGDALLAAIVGLTQLALGVMGVYVSLRPPKKERHWYWMAAFAAVGGMGIWLTYTLAKHADASQAQATHEIHSAQEEATKAHTAATDAQTAATGANAAATEANKAATAAQKETSAARAEANAASSALQKLMSNIAMTAKQGLNQVTGGGQFCYLAFGGWGQTGDGGTGIRLGVLNSGPLPLETCHILMFKQPITPEDMKQLNPPEWTGGPQQAPMIIDKDFGPLQPNSQAHPVTNTVLPVGVYHASILTRNDEFYELINIHPMNNPQGLAHVPPAIDIAVYGKDNSGAFKKQLLKRP